VETRTGPFAVYTSHTIAPDAPAIRCLNALENDVAAQLGVRVASEAPAVEIYILKDREAFNHFLHFYYPELPPRRAFFLAEGKKRMVYTFTGERLEEDLRHEATHALLHAAIGDLPLWLDEGLAEYFEGPAARRGVNPEHAAKLPGDIDSGWRPDLVHLEGLTTVREMTPRDYREAWIWIHYLLNGSAPGRAALLAYLADLHADPQNASPLSRRLDPAERDGGKPVLAHLEKIRSTGAAGSLAEGGGGNVPKILLQNGSADPAVRPANATATANATSSPSDRPAPAESRSLFGRIMAFFGSPPSGKGKPEGK
jgi:hypothetical protein